MKCEDLVEETISILNISIKSQIKWFIVHKMCIKHDKMSVNNEANLHRTVKSHGKYTWFNTRRLPIHLLINLHFLLYMNT